MNYNTSVFTGGVGGLFPGQLGGVRQQPPAFQSSMGNLPAYQQQLMQSNPQAMAEATRRHDDQFRIGNDRSANELERAFRGSDMGLRMQQMQQANGSAMQYAGMANQIRGQQMNTLSSLMQQILSGGF